MKYQLLTFFFFISILLPAQQKIGVVLSGGGASGMAHIGVLKALEENQIPIDYITGTSIGALIGGLYAAGYSPEQIERMATSKHFIDAANGIVDHQYEFYFKKEENNAAVVSWSFNLDSTFATNLPTSFVSSTPIDFGLMNYLSSASSLAKENFDSLMIPFRCIASNITERKQMVFSSGYLPAAIRASMTYPFYIAPIQIDGNVMFDGGLYNNFPADVLCKELQPDFVIASNVTAKIPPPNEDNLLSQVKSMLIKEPNFDIICSKGIIINSEVNDISTFDFDRNKLAITRGYESTIKMIDSIKSEITARRPISEIQTKRYQFKSKLKDLYFEDISFSGIHPNQVKYLKQKLFLHKTEFDLDDLTKLYLGLASDAKIKSLYPIAKLNPETDKYKLHVKVKEEKNFKASFGGVISTKPFSTGFFELDYKRLRATELNLNGNIYFGRFYSSVLGSARWDIPFDIPFFIEGQFTINQFDYFNNQATFIDNIKTAYIINSEQYVEGKIGLPALNKGKLLFGASYSWQDYEYYQNANFQRGDTSDITKFEGYSTYAKYQINSLNRKMYSNKGGKVEMMVRHIQGREETIPGSTSNFKKIYKEDHDWLLLKFNLEKYFFQKVKFRLGTSVDLTYSDQPVFQNYTATLLNAPAFQPLPETKTIFQSQYRAFSYLGVGLKAIYSHRDFLDFRLEGYIFQPYEKLNSNNLGETEFGKEISNRNFIGSFTTVYQTRVGPLAASINYYGEGEQKLSFLIHFGYIIFNKKARE
ncbi:MAG: hypothetical protein DWP98_08690 [Bacteroidetes bacterium]|nr:MAG: hypothetical protein DWP98_08690 [Bacteroidota bacterium]MBL1146021.1 hypothetical protein [Bacteroidota bacterium]NOG58815.1 patatin-like phospholipase family protein [Bacteroidota bacterium]